MASSGSVSGWVFKAAVWPIVLEITVVKGMLHLLNVNNEVKLVLQGLTGAHIARAFRRLIAQCLAMVVCCGALSSFKAYALSVSDIEVNSAVGEHFYAVVKLSDTRRIQADQVLVSIAPRSIYQRMGVDWEYFHTGLIFDVLTDEQDGMYLRIVSKDLIFEPFIDFVISVRWPSGFISKQFTVLLDMPRTPSTALGNGNAGAVALSNTAALKSGSVNRSAESLRPLGPAASDVASTSSALKPAINPPWSGTSTPTLPSADLPVSPQQALVQARATAKAAAKALVKAEEDVVAQEKSTA
ncbi:hypothetical protein N9Z31_03455, partial [Pseudomonadales bacterium]|nr:hypothetical protein [Pseudomonadales bacterium]